MKKYKQVMKNSLTEYFAYRLNFILWRVRVILSVLMSYFLWLTVFKESQSVFGYRENQMLTYMILISFLTSTVLSTQTFRVASEIYDGSLSKFLLQPINFFGFNFARDLADKIINTFFSAVEIFFLLLFLRPPFFLQTDFWWLALFLLTVVLAAFLYFFISLILSFIGFWSKETWAPRFIFFILVTFLAGTYFPLDILPPAFYKFLQFLPFTYLVYFPLKIYLGQLNPAELLFGLWTTFFWIILMILFAQFLYRRGLKSFTAEGI